MTKNLLLKFLSHSLLVVAALVPVGCGPSHPPADMVIRNGKFFTADRDFADVEAIAIRNGHILAVGSEEMVSDYIGDVTQMVDLEGRLAVPGLIDGHAHFSGIGEARLHLNLMKVSSWDEIISLVEEAAKSSQAGEWIVGRGWHQEKWNAVPDPNVEGLPVHDALSRVSPDNPVLLTHASGHALFANAKAMELAGVTASTQAPDGGEIVRDRQGKPIGVFRETAQRLIGRPYAESLQSMSVEEKNARAHKILRLAAEECLSKGITSFQDAGTSFSTVEVMKEAADAGTLGVRLYVMLSESNDSLRERLADYPLVGYGNQFLTVQAIKRLADGALGSHGAWLLEPYTDLPESSGLNTTPMDEISETAALAAEHGFQLCVHAIGDRANRETLDIYEKTFKGFPEKENFRWRIEHAQHLNPADIPRFGQLGVIAAMQGIHATSDGAWVAKRLGEERTQQGAYVWRSLLDSGCTVVNGTDAPVEDVDPIPSLYASVARRLAGGTIFLPEQRMTREEALRSYTIDAAYGAFEEEIKGSLTPGKLADIVILSEDFLTVPEEKIPQIRADMTIVGGRIVFSRNEP